MKNIQLTCSLEKHTGCLRLAASAVWTTGVESVVKVVLAVSDVTKVVAESVVKLRYVVLAVKMIVVVPAVLKVAAGSAAKSAAVASVVMLGNVVNV